MNRRDFLAISSGVAVARFRFRSTPLSQDALESSKAAKPKADRHPVLVRAGFARRANGTEEFTTSQQTVVRSFDSEGRLAAFVVPVGQHEPYRGAPLHLHHEQDEWLYILAAEFVAEVGGKRMRLKPGDSLLMPMKIAHRWSIAGQSHCGALHLYTPAGLMDVSWDPSPDDDRPHTLEWRKSESEKYGMALLGEPLTKEEIDMTI
ncbi:MAG: cupin domain-containing protein [Candidatus Acidiferrales bacterium]